MKYGQLPRNFRSETLAVVASLTTFCSALAWLPPHDSNDSAAIALVVPEKCETGDLPFSVIVSNLSSRSLGGSLAVRLNEDWRIESQTRAEISLSALEATRLSLSAKANDGALPAIYPVHAEFSSGEGQTPLHAIAVFRASGMRCRSFAPPLRSRTLPNGGKIVPLASLGKPSVGVQIGSATLTDSVEKTGGYFTFDASGRLGAHPPWRTGPGRIFADFDLALPEVVPLRIAFAVTQRIGTASEPPSDGVVACVRIRDEQGAWHTAFERTIDEPGREIPCEADLSPWAGRRVTLRLVADPGKRNNTCCDGHSWGTPVIVSGEAKAAHAAERTPLRFQLSDGDFNSDATFTAGPNGLLDGSLVFRVCGKSIAISGFKCAVDGIAIGGGSAACPVQGVRTYRTRDGIAIDHLLGEHGDETVRAELAADRGVLKVRWSLPEAKRDAAGTPRFTRLMPGAMSEPAVRTYAGFGNVVVRPKAMLLKSNGFNLSTRHVGADFPSGISLVQATDIVPDALRVVPKDNVFALEAHNDATFVFAPGSDGAFAAARRFRKASGYGRSPGWQKLAGRLCLDQWTGPFAKTAETLERLAAAGVTNAVYVRHGWQRWGYDSRLPDIWPPYPAWGGEGGFRKMVSAAHKGGSLFCPHDNMMDRFPDATSGFSYSDIVFNSDGTPQTAFFNGRTKAQSYRWNPLRMTPFMMRNVRTLGDGDVLDAYFLDVFSADYFNDFYDCDGRFHARAEVTEAWCAALDGCRTEASIPDLPIISEAGHDHLIGHLDGGQSDHFGVSSWMRRDHYEDSERVPWHDIVSHGLMVLFGGGLADRYVADPEIPKNRRKEHHYGSDDYMGVTVIGGRNAMASCSDGAATRLTAKLLGSVTAALARREMLSFEFVGGDIRHQHSTFSDGGEVWVNRHSDSTWQINGETLPPYGFIARTPESSAFVVVRDGKVVRFSK